MVLKDCLNLSWVHPSIVVLKKLTFRSLKGCINLKSLPNKFGIESLETLILSGCSKILKIPKFGENMQCVLKLYLHGTTIKEIPSSIGLLKNLKVLSFDGCKGLSSFKSHLAMISSLLIQCQKVHILWDCPLYWVCVL